MELKKKNVIEFVDNWYIRESQCPDKGHVHKSVICGKRTTNKAGKIKLLSAQMRVKYRIADESEKQRVIQELKSFINYSHNYTEV